MELPIIFGRDTWDWWQSGLQEVPDSLNAAVPVWIGSNRATVKDGGLIYLYKSTRENPRPDVEVVSIDFLSDMSTASPFLVALSVD